jgi:hypothetical protein
VKYIRFIAFGLSLLILIGHDVLPHEHADQQGFDMTHNHGHDGNQSEDSDDDSILTDALGHLKHTVKHVVPTFKASRFGKLITIQTKYFSLPTEVLFHAINTQKLPWRDFLEPLVLQQFLVSSSIHRGPPQS